MRKFFKKPISKVLAVLLIMSLIPAAAFGKTAEVDMNPDVSGSKTAAPTKLTQKARQTEVTLSLPSAEYQNEIDIVFSMDSSTSAENSTVFIESVNSLFNSILENNPNLKLKIGVVRFRGRAHDAIDYLSDHTYSGLVVYNDDTKAYIEHALNMTEAEVKAAFGSGSNTHGGIDIANEWLKADTEVQDDHKYLVLLTDGKTYIWNDENHEPTTIYAQWYRSNSYAMQNSGKPALNQVVGYNKYDYPVDVLDPTGKSNIFVFRTIEDLYNSTSPELTGVSDWDQPCLYADGKGTPNGDVSKHNVTNGAALFGSNTATFGNRKDYQYYWEFKPNADWTGVQYLEANPLKVIQIDEETYTFSTTDNGDGTFTITENDINPNYYLYHVDPLQKGIYKAAHLWTDVNEKYNCAVITYDGGSADGGLQLRLPFNKWLRDNSKYGATISEDDAVKELFKGIDNSIRYMVASGVVTDTIPNGDPCKFTLVKNGVDTFKIKVDGKEIAAAEAEDEDNKWNYGELDATTEKYPYTVEFNEEDNSYKWTINVPVENSKPVTLSYKLEIDEKTPNGKNYPTNVGAALRYVCTDGASGTYEFVSPEVEYKREEGGIGGGGGPSGSVKYVLKYESNGGTEYPDEYYSAGTRVHLDKTPIKKDYTFTGWYADEELTKPISEVLMNSDHTVYAGWEKTPVPEFFGPDHINFIVGYPDGMVHPEANITRAEVTSIFFRLLDEEVRNTNMSKTNPFGDVSEDDWFNTSVSTMSRLGIVKGYEDGDFHPNSPITRAEFAAIAARFDKRATNGSTAFSDIAGHWAELEIIKAAENGWVSGYPDGTFQPNKNITRAEAVAIVNRVLSRNPESEADLLEGMLRFPDNSNISIWYYLDIQEAANSHEYERKENNTEKWTQLIPLEDWVSIER